MAKRGIRYVTFAKLDEKTGTYTDGKYIGATTALNGSIEKAEASDYGDDMKQESASVVTGGNLTWESNSDSDEIYTYLLGHEVDDNGDLITNANDQAPYVGVGAISMAEGKFIGKFYYKVAFAEPDDENSTVTDSVTFGHTTLTGTIFLTDDGNLKARKRFDTLAEAQAWVREKCGMAS